jgi:hypothetical protein
MHGAYNIRLITDNYVNGVINENERMTSVGEVGRDAKLCLTASSSSEWLSKVEGLRSTTPNLLTTVNFITKLY